MDDLYVHGAINGQGSTRNVVLLETNPAGNTWTGNIGELARTTSHMYLCVEQDKWIRWGIQDSW